MSNLESTFKTIHSVRKSIAFILSRLTLDQINLVPEGYSNNIIWNAAHIISVQQLLVNRKSGAPYTEPKEITSQYSPGTFVKGDVDQAFVDLVIVRLVANSEQMENDYKAGLYKEYAPFSTRTKISLDNVEDAINFELFHGGLHLGYIMQLLKAVQ